MRGVHRLFYPQVPAVVTASYLKEVGALLATSIVPISLNPPIVGVALGKGHRTTRYVEQSKCFGVCWLSYEALDRAQKLAAPTPPGVTDKLKACGFDYRWGKVVRVPVLDECVAWIETVVDWSGEFGDHFFYVGRVEASYAIEDFDDYWRFMRYKPILYVGSARPEWPSFLKFPHE